MPSPKRLRFYYKFLFFFMIFQLFFITFLKTFYKDTHKNAVKILENYKMLIERLSESNETDSTGQYKVLTVKISESKKDDLTIVTQCSSNHLPFVDNLFSAWEGPISIVIYSDFDNVPKSLWDISRFLHCFNQREFAMKMVIPNGDVSKLSYKYGSNKEEGTAKSISCTEPYLSTYYSKSNYNWKKPFPVNFLRNVAKHGSTTDYILIIDIDMLPSYNLHKSFITFLNRGQPDFEETVYVIPVFETGFHTPMPLDKKEVRNLVDRKKAQPFYLGPCEKCQKRTKYDQWLESRNSTEIQILHKVEWRHPWEPFVITKRTAPNFDERFRQYGYNRVSQLCEIHMAGYDFAVLDNAFLIHKGYKKYDEFHKTKGEEMKANRLLYNRFKFQIRFKYPHTDRFC